jgi:uncharacterized coiled-coil protein SlyX
MSLQARIKNLERIIDEAGDTIEGLIEIAEVSERRTSRLSDRITALEEELRISKPGTSSLN